MSDLWIIIGVLIAAQGVVNTGQIIWLSNMQRNLETAQKDIKELLRAPSCGSTTKG